MNTIKTKHLVFLLFLFISNLLPAQDYFQYFDGADTLCDHTFFPASICVTTLGDSTNLWQVGPPQKNLFDAAATVPNVIVTDTLNAYPPNNTSAFQFTLVPWTSWGILALQWKQKLDMDPGSDGGKVEFSVDAGTTWSNIFNDPHVYNFYGFQAANADTLPNGDFVFSGTDSVWRDVWLCYDMSWLFQLDSIMLRYTFTSDSIDTQKEGWMIDNMMAHLTIIHTVPEGGPEKYLTVYPNPVSGNMQIEIQKIQDFHIIEHMQLINDMGQVVDEWRNVPTKFFVNTQKYSSGKYFLSVKTNIQTETVSIVIQHP